MPTVGLDFFYGRLVVSEGRAGVTRAEPESGSGSDLQDIHKKVLAGVAIWIVCQFFVGVWWASNLSTRVEMLEANQVQSHVITERLTRVEVQLQTVCESLAALRVELKELRRGGGER